MPSRVAILAYHALDENRSVISTPPAIFAWQMGWLHEQGYQVIPLSRLVTCLRNHESPPDRSVVITFDDGFVSVYTAAFPNLARYGFPATVFVVPDYCSKRNDWPSQPAGIPRLALMSWAQIREMSRHGIEFGAHTASHPFLDQLTLAEAEREILSSKADIEQQLGQAVELFAYPYGRFNQMIKQIVSQAFAGACSTELGLVEANSDLFDLKRVEVHYIEQQLLFQSLASPIFSLYLGALRPLRATASAVLQRPWK
jgi:peptidoglycan/xylan/chitin deacetylase (PgdA/CDA1 family)